MRSAEKYGRGGLLEMLQVAGGMARPPRDDDPEIEEVLRELGGTLDARSFILEGVWGVVLASDRARRVAVGAGAAPSLRNPLGFDQEPATPEPQPVELDPRTYERIESSGAFALEGAAGTYKMVFALRQDSGGTFAVRVDDDEDRFFAWLAAGPALPSATFPVLVQKWDDRPLVLRLQRYDLVPMLGLPWDGSELDRVWCTYLGEDSWSGRATTEEERGGAADGAIERTARRMSGGRIRVETLWTVGAADDPWLRARVAATFEGAAPPRLSSGLTAAFARAEPLAVARMESDDAPAGMTTGYAIHSADASPADPAGDARPLLYWLADQPFSFRQPVAGRADLAGAEIELTVPITHFALAWQPMLG